MVKRYVKYNSIMENIGNGGLLVGNNADWAREAVYKAQMIDLEDYVPVNEIDRLIEYCHAKIKIENLEANFGKARAYQDMIERLIIMKDTCGDEA